MTTTTRIYFTHITTSPFVCRRLSFCYEMGHCIEYCYKCCDQ